MLIVDSLKKNSEPLTWPVRKSEKQPGPWCLVCTWNLAILILEERSILCEENTHADSSSLQPKRFSCSACEESQRRSLHPVAARVHHELGICLQVEQFEWKHPVLNLQVLGTIMVDAGSRAASVTIHRAMDNEHGLGNVTGEIMLNTLLNYWIKYYGKPNSVRTGPSFARSRVSTWSCCQEYPA